MEFQRLVDEKGKLEFPNIPEEQPPYHRTEVKMIAGLVEDNLSDNIGQSTCFLSRFGSGHLQSNKTCIEILYGEGINYSWHNYWI